MTSMMTTTSVSLTASAQSFGQKCAAICSYLLTHSIENHGMTSISAVSSVLLAHSIKTAHGTSGISGTLTLHRNRLLVSDCQDSRNMNHKIAQ